MKKTEKDRIFDLKVFNMHRLWECGKLNAFSEATSAESHKFRFFDKTFSTASTFYDVDNFFEQTPENAI